MSVSAIHDHVRTGRMTPEQGAMLIELRQRLAWKRLPWWRKALSIAVRAVFS